MAHKCSLCSLEFKNGISNYCDLFKLKTCLILFLIKADQFKQHLEGKKHKKLESIRQEREKLAQRSLFVSNLKKDIFQKHLEEHFAQYGKISKVVIDHDKVIFFF